MQSPITPVTVFPGTATQLYVGDNWSNCLGQAPQFYYELRSEDGVTLKGGNAGMTVEQWQAWAVGVNDEDYILECVASALGLTLT